MSTKLPWRTLCRCCHASPGYKNIKLPYEYENRIEVYSQMLQDTFDITMKPPKFEASYGICDGCIGKLREAAAFKQLVLECEQKFEEYCYNEEIRMKEDEALEVDNGDDTQTSSLEEDIEDNWDDTATFQSQEAIDENQSDAETLRSEEEVEDTREAANDTIFQIVPKIEPIEEEEDILVETEQSSEDTENRHNGGQSKVSLWPNNTMLEIHIKTNRGEFYKCKICRKKYKLIWMLRKHLNTRHTTFKCTFCHRALKTRKKFETHVRLERRSCKLCSKTFTKKLDLTEHIQLHDQERYPCEYCEKSFAYKQGLNEHKKEHFSTKKAICDLCGREFINKYNLSDHIKSVHENLRPYKCQLCPKTFKVRKDLRDHIRIHTGEKPYKCEKCTEQFSCLWKLRQHRGKHEGFKFKCDLCDRSFPSNYSLKIHVNSHKGVRPFVCDLCGKNYGTITHLNRHKRCAHEPKAKAKKKKARSA